MAGGSQELARLHDQTTSEVAVSARHEDQVDVLALIPRILSQRWCSFHPCYRNHSTDKTAKHHLEMASARKSEKQPTALILIADGSEEIEFVTPYE